MDESNNNIQNLSEQLRGKSTTELLDQMKKKFDNRRRLFNTRNPTFDSFSRFDDNDMSHSSDIKSHLENLAKRHPEFADQLQGNPWSSESETKQFPTNSHKDWDRAHTIPMFVEKTEESGDTQGQPTASGSTQDKESTNSDHPSEGASSPNTLGKQQVNTPNSVEEDKTGKRFTSKIEITPFDPSSSQKEEKPKTPPVQPQVRHIPIYVEGRKEPIISKRMDEQQMNEGKKPATQPVEKNDMGKMDELVKEEKSKNCVALKNTLEQIDEVECDVNLLEEKVRNMSEKNNRLDKEYLFLDEMLTRNLIKLDVIEVNGNEDIRARRKNVIKNIQRCISLLESKVPSENKLSEDNNCIEDESCCREKTENESNVKMETTVENASSN